MAVVSNTSSVAKPFDPVVQIGRVALATQGVLYGIIGVLAVQLAGGRRDSTPSQRGAIQELADKPFSQVLIVAMAVGLAAHVVWRLVLAVRGEPGPDEDEGSLAKRAANLGRAAIYGSFTLLAVQLLLRSGGGSDGGKQQKSTATVLDWPAGPALVVAVGVCVVAVGAYNAYKGVSRKFVDNLDLTRTGEGSRRAIVATGVAGYLARGSVFAIVGGFLVLAGVHHDPAKTQGLDGALRKLAESSHGPALLLVVAVGLVLFGAFRIIDGLLRKAVEITHA